MAASVIAACSFAVSVSAGADSVAGAASVHLSQFAKFHFPTDIETTPADPAAVYVTERSGRIWIVRFGHKIQRPFLDLHNDTHIAARSEQGLVGMAFAPDYATSRAYYVYYTNRQGNIRLKQFLRDPTHRDRTQAGSGRTILAISHPFYPNHYGGHLAFGKDGYLYVSVGDGGGVGDPSNHAQHLNTLLGKILRIDPQVGGRRAYLIPRSNPFVHDHHAKHEIYAYGLRNPFKFAFDPANGSVWIGDVGENSYEEIDYRKPNHFAGTNFGWSRYEGDSVYNGSRSAPHAIFPVIVEAHSGGSSGTHETWCAIIGGVVVHDPNLHSLDGKYLFGDHCRGTIIGTRISSHSHAYDTTWTGLTVPALMTAFGTDPKKRVYVAAENGWVYRLSG